MGKSNKNTIRSETQQPKQSYKQQTKINRTPTVFEDSFPLKKPPLCLWTCLTSIFLLFASSPSMKGGNEISAPRNSRGTQPSKCSSHYNWRNSVDKTTVKRYLMAAVNCIGAKREKSWWRWRAARTREHRGSHYLQINHTWKWEGSCTTAR